MTWGGAAKGAISAWNPLGGLIDSVQSTCQSAVDGNYPKAAETGVPLLGGLVMGAVASKVAGGASAWKRMLLKLCGGKVSRMEPYI
jgi:hypothetical protein